MDNKRLLFFCRCCDIALNWLFLLSCLATYIAGPTLEKMYGWHSSNIQSSMAWLIGFAALRLFASHFSQRPWYGWRMLWLSLTLPVLTWQLVQGAQIIFEQSLFVLFLVSINFPTAYLTVLVIKSFFQRKPAR